MRALVVALAALVVAAPAAHAGTVPQLRLVTVRPLVVRGEQFRPGERVVVTALASTGPTRIVVRTTTRGRFGVTFPLANQPCGKAFAVRAVGSLGSRALLRVPAPPCVPPPID